MGSSLLHGSDDLSRLRPRQRREPGWRLKGDIFITRFSAKQKILKNGNAHELTPIHWMVKILNFSVQATEILIGYGL
jgi:hypothetical protein